MNCRWLRPNEILCTCLFDESSSILETLQFTLKVSLKRYFGILKCFQIEFEGLIKRRDFKTHIQMGSSFISMKLRALPPLDCKRPVIYSVCWLCLS